MIIVANNRLWDFAVRTVGKFLDCLHVTSLRQGDQLPRDEPQSLVICARREQFHSKRFIERFGPAAAVVIACHFSSF